MSNDSNKSFLKILVDDDDGGGGGGGVGADGDGCDGCTVVDVVDDNALEKITDNNKHLFLEYDDFNATPLTPSRPF